MEEYGRVSDQWRITIWICTSMITTNTTGYQVTSPKTFLVRGWSNSRIPWEILKLNGPMVPRVPMVPMVHGFRKFFNNQMFHHLYLHWWCNWWIRLMFHHLSHNFHQNLPIIVIKSPVKPVQSPWNTPTDHSRSPKKCATAPLKASVQRRDPHWARCRARWSSESPLIFLVTKNWLDHW